MPKLPGAEDLGQAPSGRSGRPIATVDTSAIGRGVATLGQGMGALSVGLKQAKKNEADVDQATRFETQRRFLEFSAKEDDELNKAGQSAQPGAFGFREGFQESYKSRAREFLATVPEALKPEYDVRLFQAEDGLAGRALTFERTARKDYYTSKVDDGLTLIENKLYQNPTAFDANLAEGNAFINSIPDEDVSPIAKEDMRRQWKTKAQLASLNGMPPNERMRALGEGADADIMSFGTGHETAKALLRKEEGFRASPYWDVNAHRVGYGSDTITRADGSVVKVRPGMSISRADAERDLDRRVAEFEATAIRQVGRREWAAMPPATQAALISVTYNYGSLPSSVVNSVKTGNIESVASSVQNLSANPGRRRNEAAMIRGQGGMGRAGGQIDPQYADMAWDERQKIIDGAMTEQKQQDAEARVTAQFAIENAISNAPVAIQNTGEYLGAMPTQEQFMAAYGDQALEKFREFEQAIETSRTVFGMQAMSNKEIGQLVKDAQPDSSGDDAALQQKRYEVISKAADTTLEQRENDPAGYVRKVFPPMDGAWKEAAAADGGNAYSAAVSMSIAAQEQLGIADVKPLPKDVVDYTVEQYKDENQSAEQRIAAATTAILSTPDPAQQRIVFEQLVDAGLPDMTEGAFAALSRGETGAAQRLFQAAMTDPSKLPGKLDYTTDAIDVAIQAQLMDDEQVGNVYYGLTDGSTENYNRAARDSKLLSNAVSIRLRNGEDLEAAITAAGKDIYGDVQVVDGDGRVNAQVLAPAGADPNAIVDGLAALEPAVRGAIETAFPSSADAPTADGSRAVLDATRQGYVDNVMAEGFFRNSGDGFVFVDPYTGAAISDDQGEPIIFKLPTTVTGPRRTEGWQDMPLDYELGGNPLLGTP